MNINSSVDTRTLDYIKIKPSTKYTMSFKGTRDAFIYFYNSNKVFIQRVQLASSGSTKTSPHNAYYAKIQYNTSDKTDIQLEEGDCATSYNSYSQFKQTVLLPCQLQKAGNAVDRLYWDNDNRRYVVEKKVYKFRMNGISDYPNSYKIESKDTKNADSNIVSGYTYINRGDYASHLGWGSIIGMSKLVGYSYNAPQYIRVYIDTSIHTDVVDSLDSINNFIKNNPFDVYTTLIKHYNISTNIKSKLHIPINDEKTCMYIETNNNSTPNLKISIDKLPQIAKDSIKKVEANPTSSNIAMSRMCINMLPESLYKDQLQEQLSLLFSSDIMLDRESASSNLDVYVKSENMLSLSLDTNSVTFDDYSGVEDMEMLGAVNLTINSSLPYQLNAYMSSEITNSDKSNTLPIDILNIRENSEADYKQFADTADKIVLKDGCVKGNNNRHSIDLKLALNQAHKADVYKTIIKFEAEQK